MFRIAALNDTCGSEDDPHKIRLTKTKEAKEAEAFAVYNKALLYQQKGHSVHAEKLLKNLLVEHPLLQEASDLVEDEKQVSNSNHRGLQLLYSVHKNMASIFLHRNELEAAIKSYIEAVRIDPSEVTVWFKMGQIALKLDKFALAKICFQQALECNNKHWPSLDQAITVTFALGDYLLCLEYISTALENDSSYPKGLALKKQIIVEHPSLESMTLHLFDNCDPEIHTVNVTKEERKEFIDEATKIRSKARQFANEYHEEQNKPVAFLEPLTPFTWKNMGEQLIKLYDFATNNKSPKSLGQEVDLRDYFFLDPSLFLGQNPSDEVISSHSKDPEKRKSPSKQLNGSQNITLQPVSSASPSTKDSAFQRASKQFNIQSPDVLGIQDEAKESALLKRMQGRMLSTVDKPKNDVLSSAEKNEEEAMDVPDENAADHANNIDDIDMPLLDTVDLDINLTDIQKIDLKPELLLKADDEDFANLADVKSLDNVLSSVIDMECEQELKNNESDNKNTNTDKEVTTEKSSDLMDSSFDAGLQTQESNLSQKESSEKAKNEDISRVPSTQMIALPLYPDQSVPQSSTPVSGLSSVPLIQLDLSTQSKPLPPQPTDSLSSQHKPSQVVDPSVKNDDMTVLEKQPLPSQPAFSTSEMKCLVSDVEISEKSSPQRSVLLSLEPTQSSVTRDIAVLNPSVSSSQFEVPLFSKPVDSVVMQESKILEMSVTSSWPKSMLPKSTESFITQADKALIEPASSNLFRSALDSTLRHDTDESFMTADEEPSKLDLTTPHKPHSTALKTQNPTPLRHDPEDVEMKYHQSEESPLPALSTSSFVPSAPDVLKDCLSSVLSSDQSRSSSSTFNLKASREIKEALSSSSSSIISSPTKDLSERSPSYSLKYPLAKSGLPSRNLSTGDLIEDVIRNELCLGGKQTTAVSTSVSPSHHQQHTGFVQQNKSDGAKKSPGTSSSLSSSPFPGISPVRGMGHKLQNILSSPTSSTGKTRNPSSPGHLSPSSSSPFPSLHPHHHHQKQLSFDFLNNPSHLSHTASSELHTLHKELALLNLPMHYLNSLSALEAEALLKASEQRQNSVRELQLLRQQSINTHSRHHHHPRQLSRSLSSPGYFSEAQEIDPSISYHHPLLSPPISILPSAGRTSSYPITTPLVPGFLHTLPNSHHHLQSVPSPYPLLSHHHDYNTSSIPYPNLYPPLSPRSKYPLIPSTSPSYLRSRLPNLSMYDTAASHHHLPQTNWIGTTSLEIPSHHKKSPMLHNPRKALFNSSSSKVHPSSHEGLSPPPAKSQKLSSLLRSDPISTSTAPSSSFHDQFQKMIEQMLESSPTKSKGDTVKTTAGTISESGTQENLDRMTTKNKSRSSATSSSSTVTKQRGPKRKLDELCSEGWAEVFRGRSTRSRSTRGRKEEPVMDIQKVLLNHFPPSLLEISEVKDGVFLKKDDKEENKVQEKMTSPIDFSKIATIAESETEDVKAFLKKCLKGNGILDLIFKYLLHLAGKVDCFWTEDLTETFVHNYKRLRKHISAPSVFDNFEGFTPDSLNDYARVMLAYCELIVDTVRMRSVPETVMSPSAGSVENELNVMEQLGKYYKEDTTFLSAIAMCDEVIVGSKHLDYNVRIYWLKAKYHQLCSETLDAIDCFQMVNETFEEMKEGSAKVIVLPNLKEERVISQQEVESQVDALQRCKSLENTRCLFENGDYSSVVDSLLHTFDKKSVKESKERPSQLLLLQESLERLGRKEDCLHWAEISIQEALNQFKTVKTQTLKQAWSNAMASLFTSMDRALNENSDLLNKLSSERLTRLAHNMVSIIKTILDVGRSSSPEMPINSLLPWILLYRILKYEEKKIDGKKTAEKDKKAVEEGVEDAENAASDDDDEVESKLKPSIKMLIQAHEHLGRHGWCTKEDGVFLFLLMRELKPLMEELEDEDDKEIFVHAFEQCLFCLYNHPSKKGKARHLHDHQAKAITLTWERAIPVFHYFTRSMMPEFDSKKTSSITADVEHLLRRIYILVPTRISPNSFLDAVTSYIDGTVTDVFVPSVLQQSLATATKDDESVQKHLYYLLADFYMKNSELKKAVKFYQLDLLMNKCRMDSWAGLALAKMSQIQQELNSTDLRLETPTPRKWDGAMRCFQRAVESDAKNRKLWVEYGLLAYQLQSHASKQVQMFASSPSHKELVLTAQDRRQKYLKSAFTSFSQASDCNGDGDGSKDDWLIHYLLGKMAEKETPDKPGIFLEHYAKAAECLHAEKALYLEKIVFATTPPHLALEALEVFYRVHAAILKLVMQDAIADQDLPLVYTASVRTLTGKFSRCEKHKQTNESEREERSSSTNITTVSGQSHAATSSKGRKTGQQKSFISDHSYSKERKISSSQSSDKSSAMSERRRQKDETQKSDESSANRMLETPKEDLSKDKDLEVFSHDVKETRERIDDTNKVTGNDSVFVDSSQKILDDGQKNIVKENENEKEKKDKEEKRESIKASDLVNLDDNLAPTEKCEKSEVMTSQSSQESERAFTGSVVCESNRTEIVELSSQISSASSVTGISTGGNTSEGQVTATTSSVQSTQESIEMRHDVNVECGDSQGSVKFGEKIENKDKGLDVELETDSRRVSGIPVENDTEIELMEIEEGGSKVRVTKHNLLKNNSDPTKRNILQKQASEGFTPRIDSQDIGDEVKMEDAVSEEKETETSRMNLETSTMGVGVRGAQVESVADDKAPQEHLSNKGDEEKVAISGEQGSSYELLKNERVGIKSREEEDQEKPSTFRGEGKSLLKETTSAVEITKGEKEKKLIGEEKLVNRTENAGKQLNTTDAKSQSLKEENTLYEDDVIMLDDEKKDNIKGVMEIDEANEVRPELGKEKDVAAISHMVDDDNDDVLEIMEVDDDYVVIPPDLSAVKSELISNCVRGIEMTASRFSSHYKSMYRLAHFHFHSKELQNVELAKDILLGRPDWQDRPGMPAPGLFFDRKGNNFFQGLWKIPIDDIDRSGSFASHVLRSVQLLLDVLTSLEDLEMLNHVRSQMKRTPDPGKKYLRDSDRSMLVEEAFRRMLDVVEQRMGAGVHSSQWSEEQREENLAHTFCVWRWGKGSCHMERATVLLHQAFRIMMKGRTDVNRLTADQAILYCQQNLSKATIQPALNAISSQGSPVVKSVSQSTLKKTVMSTNTVDTEKTKPMTMTSNIKDPQTTDSVVGARNVFHKSQDSQKLVATSQSTNERLCHVSSPASSSLSFTRGTESTPKTSQLKEMLVSRDDKSENDNLNSETTVETEKRSKLYTKEQDKAIVSVPEVKSQLQKDAVFQEGTGDVELGKEKESMGKLSKSADGISNDKSGQVVERSIKKINNSGKGSCWENAFSEYLQRQSSVGLEETKSSEEREKLEEKNSTEKKGMDEVDGTRDEKKENTRIDVEGDDDDDVIVISDAE